MLARRWLGDIFFILATGGTTASHPAAAFVSPSLARQRVLRQSLTTRQMSLEVEQKFQLSDAAGLESKLKSLGFQPTGNITFVDWYFDNDENYLSTRDCWLRCRQKSGASQWELKRGRGHSGTTVYEEIEGDDACFEAVSVLKKGGYKIMGHDHERRAEIFDGFPVPKLPIQSPHGLRPFCRLETTRSSWTVESSESQYVGLAVDLDATNTGHTVGEVETLCDESEVELGKQRVQSLIEKLIVKQHASQQTAIGKLEHFLMNNRPDHYAACVASGVIQKTT